MSLREYAGAAKSTTLVGDITAGSAVITVADATGYPTGATGPFAIAMALGDAEEEKILILNRSGNTLNVHTRGYDGTSASAHSSGTTVDHVLTAIDVREANEHVNDSTGDPHPQYLTEAEGNAAYVAKAGDTMTGLLRLDGGLFVAAADPGQATITTGESTTSTAYTDLATIGPTVTRKCPASGLMRYEIAARSFNSTAGQTNLMSVEIVRVSDGSVLRAAGDEFSATVTPSGITSSSFSSIVAGVVGADYRFRAKYRVSGGTGTWVDRALIVTPLI
jgi:hypothetical protein